MDLTCGCSQVATGDRLSCLNATNAPTAAPTGGLRESAKAAAAVVSAAVGGKHTSGLVQH